MASNRARESGFSLLELIIVLMVMISLLAIVWPNLQRPLRLNSLSEAAQTLRTAIDDSRYQAITTGKPVFVQLRQGNDLVRAGAFDSFASAEGEFAGMGTSSLQPATLARSVGGVTPSAVQSTLRSWKLPATIVISEVRWTLAAPAEEFGDEFTESPADSLSPMAEVQSDAMFATGFGQTQDANRDGGGSRHTWWLPLVATGQGRDAAIVLLDTSINEEVTVTFASATGALEIVR